LKIKNKIKINKKKTTKEMNFMAFPYFTGSLTNVMQSDGKTSTQGNIPQYANGSGTMLSDSGFQMSDKVSVDGSSIMTGNLDMNANEVKNTGHIRPRDTDTFDLGSSTKRYKRAYIADELTGQTYSRLVVIDSR
jgi:hypothetical protein